MKELLQPYHILLAMLFLHVLDDFHLQGILAKMKQKKWWKEQKGFKDLYKDDYKTALLMHCLSWSIIVTSPFWLTRIDQNALMLIVFANAAIHYWIDDLKYNQMKISLETDQMMHIIQIYITWLICSNAYM